MDHEEGIDQPSALGPSDYEPGARDVGGFLTPTKSRDARSVLLGFSNKRFQGYAPDFMGYSNSGGTTGSGMAAEETAEGDREISGLWETSKCLEGAMERTDDVEALVRNPELQKRLAKYLVHRCFRNSILEDLHAGTAPSSKSGDYSDVAVVTPFGEIPWGRLSRFDDSEMKTLMIDVVQRTYEFIRELFDHELSGSLLLRLGERDPLPRWEDPK